MSLLLLLGGGDPNAKTTTATVHVGVGGAGTVTDHAGASSVTAHVGGFLDGPNALERETLGALIPAAVMARGAGTQVDTDEFLATLRRPEIVWVEDIAGDRVAAVHDLLDLEVEEQLQRSQFLRFEVAADSTKADYLLEDVVVQYRDVRYRITAREERGEGTRATVWVEAAGLWNDLAGTRKVGGFKLEGVSPTDGLATIVAGTGWITYDDTDVTTSAATLDGTDSTVLELLRDWARVCGGELVFVTSRRIVRIVAEQGTDRGVAFRYRRNLRNIRRRSEPPRATRLFAFGRDGLDLVGVTDDGVPYVEDFTWYTNQGLTEAEARASYTRDEVWFADEITSDDVLLDRATERLAQLAVPLVTYECSVLDLSSLANVPDEFEIGDTVRVRDERFGFDVRTRVVRLKRKPLQPWLDEIELASLQSVDPTPTARRVAGGYGTRWVLFRDSNGQAATIDSTEQRLGLFPRWNLVPDQGDYVGGFTVRAVATGSGTVTFRLYDYVADAVLADASWSFDFNAATFDDVVFTGSFSRKGQAGEIRLGLLADVTSGSGSLAVAAEGSDFHALVLGLIGSDDPLPITSQLFEYTGAYEYFTVPDGVSLLTVTVDGAEGGQTGGGLGSRMKCRMAVVPGEVLEIAVGGQGGSPAGGWPNGGSGGVDPIPPSGGGGGGSSGIRRSPYSIDDQVVEAAGGGGGAQGGAGDGGVGGWPNGYTGTGTLNPGGGGTQLAGGAGGPAGTDGTRGQGGEGEHASGGRDGGGGGGGYYGGGGGGAEPGIGQGGGGGGSSYFDESAGVDLVTAIDGYRAGDGEVLIEW